MASHPPPPARENGPPGASEPLQVERSAGGVVVRVVRGAPRVLLIRDPYDRWGLPKGHLEGEEREAEAALREVREETGLRLLRLGPDLGRIDWIFRLKGRRIHKYCRFYLMSSPEGGTRPQLTEGITECRWFSLSAASDRVDYENARGILERAARWIRIPEHSGIPPWREGSA